MAEIVDAFAHIILEDFHDHIKEHRTLDTLEKSKYYRQGLALDVEEHLQDMDDFGIDRQVVSQQPPQIWEGLDPAQALPLVRAANDEIATIADSHPDRFVPVATLPFLGEPFLAELDRCINDLDMVGVQIFSNVQGRPLDSPEFAPFFDMVDSLGVPIWLHPTSGDWSSWANLDGHRLPLILGWPMETTLAMIRLVLGGVMDDHPNLDVVCHHMGGAVSSFASRASVFYTDVQHPDGTIEDYKGLVDGLRRFYPDTARQGDTDVLESGCEFFGTDRMVFGTDYPFGPDNGKWFMREELKAVMDMELEEVEREMILGGNIRTLIDR